PGGVDCLPVPAQRRELQVGAALLAVAEDRALAPDVEVDLGQLEAVVGLHHRLEAGVALGPLLLVALGSPAAGDQVAVRRRCATTDTAAQLVELGDSEAVG